MDFRNKIILAPMEDVTDAAFRLTCKKYGADIVWTEMLHSRSAVKGKDLPLLLKEERPLAVQVAGNNVEEVVQTARAVEDNCDIIDINLGCPGNNVISSGYGSSLLRKPKLIGQIIKALVDNIALPVTAKMRAGFKRVNAARVAKLIEKSGASAITLHPRTQAQGYGGKADWGLIAKVRKELSIPVIGNGDVRTGKDAKEMLKIADSVMIGRAAIGDPLIFKRVKGYLATGRETRSTKEEKIKAFEQYIRYAKKYKLLTKPKLMRQAQCFTKGIKGAAKLRDVLSGENEEMIIQKTKEFIDHTMK
ncbi:tRNA-dihydrouridine synthase family protein [Candidatus Woesearchaeota archaeon]|nr:tRNA-dihydrouridine synthase family protein [Candidatus Woesearchaeota archaeon]